MKLLSVVVLALMAIVIAVNGQDEGEEFAPHVQPALADEGGEGFEATNAHLGGADADPTLSEIWFFAN